MVKKWFSYKTKRVPHKLYAFQVIAKTSPYIGFFNFYKNAGGLTFYNPINPIGFNPIVLYCCCIVFIYSSKIIIDTSFIVCYIIYNFIMTGDHPI